MLKIRLQRVGRKNDPAFRVVVVDSKRGPKSGDNVEILGSYNPRFNKAQVKPDRVKHWMSVGAQVSDTVHNLLINEKIIEGKKINVLSKKSPVKSDESQSDSTSNGAGPIKKEEEPKPEASKEEVKTESEPEISTEEAPEEEAPKEEEKKEETEKEEPKVEKTESSAEGVEKSKEEETLEESGESKEEKK